jgi:hypothetical protein
MAKVFSIYFVVPNTVNKLHNVTIGKPETNVLTTTKKPTTKTEAHQLGKQIHYMFYQPGKPLFFFFG